MTVLLFDIDNTLLDFDKAEYDALGKIFTHYQIEDNQENRATYSRENKALWRLHESEKLSREELLSTRFDHAFRALNVSVNYNPVAVDDEYQLYLSQGHELINHGKELLTELSAKEAEIFESGISDHFREIFISEEVGHHKPSLAFFDYVFDHIEAANQKEFTIVGDSLATDILGGNRAGIKTIWYNPKQLEVSGEAQPDVQIQDLLEIPALVKNW